MLLSILSIFFCYIRVFTQILKWMCQTFLSIIIYKHIISEERRRALYRRHRCRLSQSIVWMTALFRLHFQEWTVRRNLKHGRIWITPTEMTRFVKDCLLQTYLTLRTMKPIPELHNEVRLGVNQKSVHIRNTFLAR